MKKNLNLLLVILLLFGCDPDDHDQSCQDDGPNMVNIRILNLSAFELIDLNYDNIQTFNSVLPGEFTPYMQVESAKNDPTVLGMEINGVRRTRFLIDGFGLSELDKACYTYLLPVLEFGDGGFIATGTAYLNSDLNGFEPVNQYCAELEKSDCNPDLNKANIRIKNATAFGLCNIDIDINAQENAIFGNLGSGETTCYISVESLKKYPLESKFIVGDEEFKFTSTNDHERLEDFPPGFYTYHIYISRPSHKKGGVHLTAD